MGNALPVIPDSPKQKRKPMDNYTVYKHTSPNGKVYIGITCQPTKARWKNGKGYKNNDYFYNAILKYGWENFEHKILKTGLTQEEADYWEKYYIKKCKTYHKINEDAFNLTIGGTTNYPKNARKNNHLYKENNNIYQ